MKDKNTTVSEKLEDYILSIFRLTQDHGHAHLSDLARISGVKNSSANSALNSLNEKGLVEYSKYRPILLTENGRKIAKRISKRRDTLFYFFKDVLELSETEAKKTAHKVEHIFEDAIIDKLMALVGKTSKKNLIQKQ